MAVSAGVVVAVDVDRGQRAPLFVREMSGRIAARMCGNFRDESCGRISAVGKPVS